MHDMCDIWLVGCESTRVWSFRRTYHSYLTTRIHPYVWYMTRRLRKHTCVKSCCTYHSYLTMYIHPYVRPSFIRVMWPHTHVSQAVRAKDESGVTHITESWHTPDHILNIIITHSLFVTDTALNSLQCLYDRDTALNSVICVTCDMTQSYVWHLTNTSWQYRRDSVICELVA